VHKIHSIDRIEGFRQLSARETQLIVLASEGLTDKEIARFLGISNGTVVTMWSRMRAKLGISSRVSAVAVVVSAVSRLCERFVAMRSLGDDWVSHRVLVSAKNIVLSCDDYAVDKLGIRPGHSLSDRVLTGFSSPAGTGLTEADLPWRRTFETGEKSCTELATQVCSYRVECTLGEDTTLGRTVLVEFVPTKTNATSAVAEPLQFRLAAAK
jgi:DNA-binding CsgD family transcriptional regulator